MRDAGGVGTKRGGPGRDQRRGRRASHPATQGRRGARAQRPARTPGSRGPRKAPGGRADREAGAVQGAVGAMGAGS